MDGRVIAGDSTRTLAIICGASAWPRLDGLDAAEAFKSSAEAVRAYLVNPDLMAVPEDNVLWLFDVPDAVDNLDRMGAFLTERLTALAAPTGRGVTLIFVYVGHGDFPEDEYCLLLRDTRKPLVNETSLRVAAIARVLRHAAPESARLLLLDCCFAGRAVQLFQSSLDQVVNAKAIEVLEAEPQRGVALLCAASKWDTARLESLSTWTQFGRALTDVLATGDAAQPGPMTLRRVCVLTRTRLRELFGEDAPVPEVHVPFQAEGDLAALPMFPNPAAPVAAPAGTVRTRSTVTLHLLDGKRPVTWKSGLVANIRAGTTRLANLRPDREGIIVIETDDAVPLIVELVRTLEGQRRYALAPIRPPALLPAAIEIDLADFPRDAWTLDPVPVDFVEVGLGAAGLEVLARSPLCDLHGPWGLPGATIVVQRDGYVLGTEPGWHIPRWVAHRVRPGPTRERGPFRADPELRAAERVVASAYAGTGFDRGHLVSVGDLQPPQQDTAMYMSVVTPQHPMVNQQTWRAIELYTRRLAAQGPVVALSGPVFLYDAGRFHAAVFGNPPILVPDGFFRVVAQVPEGGGPPLEPIVFLIPNEPQAGASQEAEFLGNHLSTVAQVEDLTGLGLFGYCDGLAGKELRRGGVPELPGAI